MKITSASVFECIFYAWLLSGMTVCSFLCASTELTFFCQFYSLFFGTILIVKQTEGHEVEFPLFPFII